MKQHYTRLISIFAFALLAAGCATGYKSQLTFSHLKGNKYKLDVKVSKVSRTPFSTTETDLCQLDNLIWEHGELRTTKSLIGNEQSGVFVSSFVPKDDKADLVFNVELRKNGNVKMSSNFKLKQTTK